MNCTKWIGLTATLAMALVLGACSDDDSTGPAQSASVTMEAKLTASSVSRAQLDGKGAAVQALTVDSVAVARARILVTELKLHDKFGDDNDSLRDDDKTVKVGPMVIDAVPGTTTVFATDDIPAGSYDKIKFEFHRFNGSEVGEFINDAVFGPFVQDDRWSVIIDGIAYENGSEYPFTYRSDITANLSLKFPDIIDVGEGETAIVIVEIDPVAVFAQGNGVLDPRDGSNESKIDNAIKSAIKALKK